MLTRRSRRRRMRAPLMLIGGGVMLVLLSTASSLAIQGGWGAARHGQAGRDLNAVYFADSKRGWAVGDGGFMIHTEDGGKSWTRQPVDTAEGINDVYFRDKEDGYVLAGSRIFGTEDGGLTWRETIRFSPSTFSGALPELYSVRFAGKKKGWVVGSTSRRDIVIDSLVLFTDDSGASWQRQLVPTREELIHLDFAGDRRGWIVGAGGIILHTRDGGLSWTAQRSNTDATLYHVDFRNDNDGWAVGQRGTVLRTTDGGETWTTVSMPLRSTLLSVKFANDDDGWIVGRGGVVLRSGDGGLTWVQQQSGTKQNLYALFIEKKNCWAVGGDGMVLRYER